jgi:hypothetical protein
MTTETMQGPLCTPAWRPKAAATSQRTRLRIPPHFTLNTSQRHQRDAAAA